MPIISTDELKRLVIDGTIGAISIDTSTIEHYQFGFEVGLLAKLSQFSRGYKFHLILDIVLHEIRSHLKEEADLTKAKAKNALKPLGNSWGIEKEARDEALHALFGDQSGLERTEVRLNEFIRNSSATLIKCEEWVKVSEVLSRYMDIKPPFGDKEAKKREFPDAFALLALEGWAAKNKKVVAVSRDKDWRRFCTDSELIYYSEDLAHALSAFQSNDDDAANALRAMLDEGKLINLDEELLDAMNSQSDKIEVDFEANSNWYYEQELSNVTITADEPLAAQVRNFEVVEYQQDTLVIQTTVRVNATAQFEVSFEQFDSIDREYIGMGSTTVEGTDEIEVNLILTVIFDEGDVAIDNVELLPEGISMDFGEIYPDWMDDREEEEEEEEDGSQ
ncbi:PIN domain-containing protein [Achromobacter insolitus]|uniref:PIN domain-containing protein n=1 Tax=Achromobacter insolitus TaxID=217204 RepID=UPI001041F5D2|nr:PIN domain-containing protein [Achromobacter insolitus]